MENKELVVHQSDTLIPLADDFLIQVADQAEKRIDAVMKIKRVALKVTNPRDWTDQQGNPYLQASGSEKIANLFNISWRIDEPACEEDGDGHYTYAYKGYFSLGSRTIEAEGSRSSRDTFFAQYKYKDEQGNELAKRQEVPLPDRSNKRDVKMAALTNLLGNGITRILGIRNLTWDDLKEFANITREQVTTIQYKKGGKEPIQEPKKKNGDAPQTDTLSVVALIIKVLQKDGKKKDGNPWTLYTLICDIDGKQKNFATFSKTIGEVALKAKGTPALFEIHYKDKGSQYPGEIIEDGLIPVEPPEDADAQI